MPADKRIWKSLSLLFPTAGMLGLYAYIATFSRLIGDDYCLLYFADRFGLLRSIWYWYINFEGIFSGVFVDYFLVYFGEKWMGVVLPAILLLWVGFGEWPSSLSNGPMSDPDVKISATLTLSRSKTNALSLAHGPVAIAVWPAWSSFSQSAEAICE